MSIKNVKIFGMPDLFALHNANVSAGSVASADFPDDNMLSEMPSDTWRSDGYDPTNTFLNSIGLVRGANFVDMTIGGLGLVNHNLWPWTGDIRFVLFSGTTPPISDMFEMLVPTSITASTNLNGVAVGDIDNGFISTPGVKAGPSDNTLAWSITVALSNPTADPLTGDNLNLQTIHLLVNSQADRLPSEALTVSAFLLDGTTDLLALGTKSACRADGHWINFKFDADDLLTADGSALAVRFEMNVDPTLAAPDEFTEIDEIVVQCETVSSMVGAANYLADSGWLPAGTFVANPRSTHLPRYLPQELTHGDCIAWDMADSLTIGASELQGVQTVAVLIREDHSPDHTIYDVSSFPTMPPGYVEAGHIVGCGAVFTAEVNVAPGPLNGVRDLSTTKFTQGGSQFGQRNGVLRTAVLDFPALTLGESAFLADRLLRRRGTSRPVLVWLLSGDFFEFGSSALYATLSQQETTVSTQLIEDYRRKLTLNLVEYR